jgi:hypothetical protein
VVGFGSGPGPLPLAPFISLLFKWATVFLFKNSFLLNVFDFIATSIYNFLHHYCKQKKEILQLSKTRSYPEIVKGISVTTLFQRVLSTTSFPALCAVPDQSIYRGIAG